MSVPFAERGGRLRGGIDLLSGRLPGFIFGGRVGELLPIFHFHDEASDDLEPKLRYLAENRYRTVSADDIAAYLRGQRLPERSVALCFDDAWASVWTMAGPLLKRYGLMAIVYPIPGRTDDAPAPRAQEATTATTGSPFMTWPELRALASDGTIDVQSHTFSHAMVDTSDTPTGFIDPNYQSSSFLGRPLLDVPVETESSNQRRPRFASPEDLGAPLYPSRSGMSDAPRVRHAEGLRDRCLQLVRSEGGAAFFTGRWQERLRSVVDAAPGSSAVETPAAHQQRIERELDDARTALNAQLGTAHVRHVCLPWGVSGTITEAALGRLGFSTAIANRMPGVFAVRAGDDPFWLKRLPNRYIYRLPGVGRRWWFLS